MSRKNNIIKSVASLAIAGSLMTGCSGGGGSSGSPVVNVDSNLSSSEMKSKILSDYPSVEQNVSVQVGFSPVQNRTCDFYFQNSAGSDVCLNLEEKIEFKKHPSINNGVKKVDYFVDLTSQTRDSFDSNLSQIDGVTKKPMFTSNFPVDFGVSNDYNNYLKSGEICTDNGVVSLEGNVSSSNGNSNIVSFDSKENGCYDLPESAHFDGFGTYNFKELKATDSNGNLVVLTGDDLAHFTYNHYENNAPESNVSVVGSPMMNNGEIRDVNGVVTLNCSGSDVEDGSNVSLSAKYKSSADSSYTNAVLKSNGNFDVNVSSMGGNNLEAICSASDSLSVKTDSNLTKVIAKNNAPVYESGLVGDVSCNVGDSINLGTPVFSDFEDDNVTLNNFNSNYSCDTAGTFNYSASASDEFDANGSSPVYTITVVQSSDGGEEGWGGGEG